MVVTGGVVMTIGLVADAISNADDSAATREGLFDLSSFPHALFFGGIALAVVGLLTLVFGTWIYKPGRVTVGRRLLQVGAPIAAIALVGGCAAIADGSQYAEPHAVGTDAATGAEAASTDEHAMDHSEAEMNAAEGDAHSESHESEASSVPPKKYDPALPIDLGGVEGVTPEQQARAENLIAITLARLPQFTDYKVAEAAGFRSIGDALTGDEHFINIAYFDDGAILNPDRPESLVYEPQPDGSKKLVAAMFMLAPNQTLDDVPDIGGSLTQWHIHNNLCFTSEGRVAGLSNAEGKCREGLNSGSQAPMIHVWITPHPCGPFAALEGVGAGQIKEGETRLCDEAHGHGA
jgi:hypothetical protein